MTDQSIWAVIPIQRSTDPSSDALALITIFADALNDAEACRIANENRLRSLVADFGLAESPPALALEQVIDNMKAWEHDVELELKHALRQHPLGRWQRETVGVGERQLGRLLAVIGDPAWHDREARPRRLSELWAYCGLHVWHIDHARNGLHVDAVGVPSFDAGGQAIRDSQSRPASGIAPYLKSGQRPNWNVEARQRVYLIASKCIMFTGLPDKNGRATPLSPYRKVYDVAREKYAEATHSAPCVRCGPSKHPAPIGSDLSDAHKHARALRIVMKEILRDLWRASGGGEARLPVSPKVLLPRPSGRNYGGPVPGSQIYLAQPGDTFEVPS